MLSQFTGSADFELSKLYTAERFLNSIGDSRGMPSHIPSGTELELFPKQLR